MTVLIRHDYIFQLTFSSAESSDKKSLQLAAVFNDPDLPLRCSRLKRRAISLLRPAHQPGNTALQSDDGWNICASGKTERRGLIPFLILALFSTIGEDHREEHWIIQLFHALLWIPRALLFSHKNDLADMVGIMGADVGNL